MQVGVSQTAFILQNHLLCNAFRDARRRADVVWGVEFVVVFLRIDVVLEICSAQWAFIIICTFIFQLINVS